MFPRRNPLLRLVGVNLVVGVIVSLGAVLALVVFDVGHLRSLAVASSDGALALSLLTFGFVITFGSTAIGSAIMLLPRGDEGSGRGRATQCHDAPMGFALQPASVHARRSRSLVR